MSSTWEDSNEDKKKVEPEKKEDMVNKMFNKEVSHVKLDDIHSTITVCSDITCAQNGHSFKTFLKDEEAIGLYTKFIKKLYLSFVDRGFTRNEAVELTKTFNLTSFM